MSGACPARCGCSPPTWCSTGHPTLEEAQAVGEQVKAAIAEPFAISHSTLELECERCNDDDDPCLMEAVTVSSSAHLHPH